MDVQRYNKSLTSCGYVLNADDFIVRPDFGVSLLCDCAAEVSFLLHFSKVSLSTLLTKSCLVNTGATSELRARRNVAKTREIDTYLSLATLKYEQLHSARNKFYVSARKIIETVYHCSKIKVMVQVKQKTL